MKLLIGLGNPGQKYKHTRHNVGEEFVRGWLRQKRFDKPVEKKRLQACVSKATVGLADNYPALHALIIALPTTFMNNSGLAVQKLAAFYKVDPKDILIVHDDIDLRIGKLRLSSGGYSGGHNGIKSIIKYLGTNSFSRLKIGINPTDEFLRNLRLTDTSAFVIKKFTKEEKEVLQAIFPKAVEMIDNFL